MESEPNDQSSVREPSVAILLCTLRGHDYLREQLDSIVRQAYKSWSVWVSDDGSDRSTHAILDEYQASLGSSRFSILCGPAKGFATNFLSLACNANIDADYYAYADQDDIWESDKLTQALQWLEGIPADVPALYCARTRKVDADNHEIGFSEKWTRPPCFANALVQSIASGNTMVFNKVACDLLRIAGSDIEIAAHDWWTYQLVSGSGGRVFHDTHPTVRYRQHSQNLIGTNGTPSARIHRLHMLLKGRFSNWSQMNIAALEATRAQLTEESQIRLDEFSKARQGGLLARISAFRRSGVYRQTWLGNLGLVAAVILKKL
jgi:glycosyltransferase involved in cell wall biosynthesis